MRQGILFILLTLFTGLVFAQSSEIGVVDIVTVFKSQKEYQQKMKQLAEIKQTFVKKMQTRRAEADLILKKLNNNKLSAAQRQQLTTKINQIKKLALKQRQQWEESMHKKLSELHQNFRVRVNKALQRVAHSHNYQLIIIRGVTVYHNPSLDVTKDVIKQLNHVS